MPPVLHQGWHFIKGGKVLGKVAQRRSITSRRVFVVVAFDQFVIGPIIQVPSKHAPEGMTVYLGVVLGIYHQIVFWGTEHFNTANGNQVEEPKAFVAADVEEYALLTVVRSNAGLDVVIESRV